MWERLSRWWLDTIFPPRCGSCGVAGSWWCEQCWKELALVRTPVCYRCGRLSADFKICPTCHYPFGLSRLVFCGYWQDPLRRLILSFKYRRLRVVADHLITLMVGAWALTNASVDIVVPIPLHWQRGWQRGFNQAEVLARKFANQLGVPMVNLLVRRRSTRPQFQLVKSIRKTNVIGAFKVRNGQSGRFNGKIILLIDDVVATGSTMEECAKILRQKGARQVWGLTVARA